MKKITLSNRWGLPLPAGVAIETHEERQSVVVLCQNEDQYRQLFQSPQPGRPTPAQLICARAAASPAHLKFFCVKVGKKRVGHLEMATLDGCMELSFKDNYPVLDDNILGQCLKKSLDDGRSFGIVNMANNVSLFSSSNIGKFSRCGDAKRMHGIDVSQFWPDDQLRRYRADLERFPDGMDDYQYEARTFDGERMRFTVNARLWWYRGDIVRLTETLASTPVLFEI